MKRFLRYSVISITLIEIMFYWFSVAYSYQFHYAKQNEGWSIYLNWGTISLYHKKGIEPYVTGFFYRGNVCRDFSFPVSMVGPMVPRWRDDSFGSSTGFLIDFPVYLVFVPQLFILIVRLIRIAHKRRTAKALGFAVDLKDSSKE